MPPVCNPDGIAAEQDFRHFPASEFRRSGIYGWREETVLERIKECRGFIVQDTRQKPAYGICKYSCRELTAAQDIIPYGNFFCNKVLADAIINAFIVTRNNKYIFFQ